MEKLAFYCVSERKHFLGLVALVNSLRLLGHGETVYVLDCGFDPWQRAVLAQDRAIVVVPASESAKPTLLKTILPQAQPAEIMFVVDVDVIFTGRIDALVDIARASRKPIFFPDCCAGRFDPAWERLGFGPAMPHAYVAAGQFVLPAASGRDFLDVWTQGLERLAAHPALTGPRLTPEDPFFFLDMDVLNALIGPVIPLDSFTLAERTSVAYPTTWDELRVVDAERLLVEFPEGSRPLLLHHFGDKPWSQVMAANPYSRLMTRLLCADDVELRVARSRIPYALRGGAATPHYVASRLWIRHARRKLGIRRWDFGIKRRLTGRRLAEAGASAPAGEL